MQTKKLALCVHCPVMDELKSSEQKQDRSNKSDSFLQNLRNYFTEYCENSCIHGIKYIGEQNRLIIEKLWWFTALTFALFFCTILIKATYYKWENSPVLVSFATTETPIWKIPFPAVTICPQTKSLPQIFNYSYFISEKKRGEEIPSEDDLRLSYVSALCTYNPKVTFDVSDYVDEEILDNFHTVAPQFVDKISDCSFMGVPQNCSELFTPIITDEGVCFSFNLMHRRDILANLVKHFKNFHAVSINASEWSLDNGYDKKAAKNTYPRRALYAGASFAFELKIETPEEDLDHACSKTVQGYKIQIHHPSMLPRVKQQHFRIPLDQVVLSAIMPSMISTSEEIKHYSPERRQCFFSTERKLKYFKIYTQMNCQIECKTNFTLKMCGCVDFYMPRENPTKICGAPMKKCMLDAEKILLSHNIENQLRRLKGLPPNDDVAHKTAGQCNCLPDCTSVSYVVENSQADWDWVKKSHLEENSSAVNQSTTHKSYLQIFFKANQFITSERNELFGPTDFLANCGGLLGLFTGFSFLSLAEILYFLTLRIFSNIRLFGVKYWSGKDKKK